MGPVVGSGGADKCLLLWDLAESGVPAFETGGRKRPRDESVGDDLHPFCSMGGAGKEATVGGKAVALGQIDDVAFKAHGSGCGQVLASVGGGEGVWVWDSRVGEHVAVARAEGAGDGLCCAWCTGASEWALAVGSEDGKLRIWDFRSLQGEVGKGELLSRDVGYHTGGVTSVVWYPRENESRKSFPPLASAGADGVVVLWDAEALVAGEPRTVVTGEPRTVVTGLVSDPEVPAVPASPDPVILVHRGHRAPAISDLRWAAPGKLTDDWLFMSLSDDSGNPTIGGGGTLQLWRPCTILTKGRIW
jgi:WD40 repeat protein